MSRNWAWPPPVPTRLSLVQGAANRPAGRGSSEAAGRRHPGQPVLASHDGHLRGHHCCAGQDWCRFSWGTVMALTGICMCGTMRLWFSNLITLRDKKELIVRLDKVYYITSGNKVGLRKIRWETASIKRHSSKLIAGDPRKLLLVIRTVMWSKSPMENSLSITELYFKIKGDVLCFEFMCETFF